MQCRARNPTPSPVATGANVLSKSKDWVRCKRKRRFCGRFVHLGIPGTAAGRSPESRTTKGVHIWIPGSLAPLAPRNDAAPDALENITDAGRRIPDAFRYRLWRRGKAD